MQFEIEAHMNILITGASGFIGRHLLQTCIDKGHQVTACVRDAATLPPCNKNVKIMHCDFTTDHDVNDWLPRLIGIDAVINAVGIFREKGLLNFESLHTKAPSALFKACEIKGIKKVVQISALGADQTAFSRYHLSKKAADDFLSGRDLDWAILMPSIVYGPGAGSMRLFKALAALPVTPLIGEGDQQIQPIHVDDLTIALVALIESDTVRRQYIEAVGPEPVTLVNLCRLLKIWFGYSRHRFVKISFALALFFARIAGRFGNSPLTADALKMLQTGNTANARGFVEAFGFTPASLQQTLLRQPPLAGDYLDAKLYFLLPLLKFTLAILWIATGLISAFAYPVEASYSMLSQLGITGVLACAALYAACALDIGLGAALLLSRRMRIIVYLQIAVMLAYTALITIGLPELWLHPFGPVSKNIALIVATLMLLAWEA